MQRIVIIGAGPVGCYTAQVLKNLGYECLVVEEHAEVGRPLHCTGLVGKALFEDKRPFGVKIPSSAIANTINGAVLHFDGDSFSIKREKVAYVVDREKFDKELSRGLDIAYENKFLGLEKSGAGYIVETDKGEFTAGLVIGADGASSAVRKILNPNANSPKMYKGVQLRLRTKHSNRDCVEVYLNNPAFFWVVPEADDIIRVGTICDNPHQQLQNFLKINKIKGEVLDKFGGVVTIGVCDVTARGSIAIVGDAACQMKPLTYGGVYFGLRAADILAGCIKNGHLEQYDYLWKRELASEIKIGIKIRGIYERLDSKEFKQIFKLLKNQKGLIEKFGDFENHSRLFREIIRRPSLYPQIGSLFSVLFKKIFE